MTKRRMLKMNLDEISSVDRPAQEPALVAMFKRADAVEDEEVLKDKDEHGYGSNAHGGGAQRAKVVRDKSGAGNHSIVVGDKRVGTMRSTETGYHGIVHGSGQSFHGPHMGDVADQVAHAHEQQRGMLFGASPGGGGAMSKLAPKQGEQKADYVARFMADPKMQSEYSDEKQRLAVAYSMYGEPAKKEDGYVEKTDFSAEQRQHLADSGAAMPGGEFPIRNAEDLQHAMRALGRAKDRAATIAHIKTRARALGLTDQLSNVYKSDTDNAGQAGQENKMTEQEMQALQKRAERAEKLASLNDAQKALFTKMDAAKQDEFLALTPEQRQAEVAKEVAKAQDSNPVLETIDGVEFRKNDDPRLLKMAKQLKEERDGRAVAQREARAERMEKRAKEELKFLPGETAEKVLLLEAIEAAVPSEKRESVLKILKAQNAQMATAFEKKGTTEGNDADEAPAAKLEKLAKGLAEKDKSLTYAQAYTKVLGTPEGISLQAEMIGMPLPKK